MAKASTVAKPQGWLDFLSALPLHNEAADVLPLENDLLPITVRVDRPPWLVPPISWVLPLSARRTVKLDGLGRFVWELCNGRNRIEQIVDRLAQRERLTFHEARIALTQQIQMLVRRGVVVLVVDKEGER